MTDIQLSTTASRSNSWRRLQLLLKKLTAAVFLRVRMDVLERDLNLPIGEGEPLIPVTWREGTLADIDGFTLTGLNYSEGRKEVSRESFREGDRFIVGLHGEDVAHVAWVSFGQITFSSFSLKLGPKWAYFYDTRTDERFRGNRIHGRGIREIMAMSCLAGATRAVTCVDKENVISRKNYEREGFRVISTISTYRLLRKWRRASVPSWLQPYLLTQSGRPPAVGDPIVR